MFEIQIEDHKNKLISSLQSSFENGSETNCALVCEGKTIRCHKYLLVAFSHHFRTLFAGQPPAEHSIIIYVTNMKFEHLKILIESIYYGRLKIAKEQLPELLKSAQSLGFTHLCNTDFWKFTNSEQTSDNATDKDIEVISVSGRKESATLSVPHTDEGMKARNASPQCAQQPKDVIINEQVLKQQQSQSQAHGELVSPKVSHPFSAAGASITKPLANVAPNTAPVKISPKIQAVPQQLFSEANCILSRCLELISKPTSSGMQTTVSQSIPTTTFASSNLIPTCAPISSLEGNYNQIPAQPRPANSFSAYKSTKSVEPQNYSVALNEDLIGDRVRYVEHATKMQASQYLSNKAYPINYPKGYSKPHAEPPPTSLHWKYPSSYPQMVPAQRPYPTPLSPQNQKADTNVQIQNYVRNPEPLSLSIKQRQNIPKLHSHFHPGLQQPYMSYDQRLHSFQKPLSGENQMLHSPTTVITENPMSDRSSIRRDSSHTHSQALANRNSSLLSQALLVSPDSRHPDFQQPDSRQLDSRQQALRHLPVTDNRQYLASKDPFQALISAKAALEKKKMEEEAIEKKSVSEDQTPTPKATNLSPNVSYTSSHSSTSPIQRSSLSNSTLSQDKRVETPLQPNSSEEYSNAEQFEIHASQNQERKSFEENNGRKEENDEKRDKIIIIEEAPRSGSVSNESDIIFEDDIDEKDIEGESAEDYNERRRNELNLRNEGEENKKNENSGIQPPFKKRKSSAGETKSGYPCEVCGKVLSCYYYMQEHIRVKHKRQNLTCTIVGCDYQVLERNKLKQHLIDVHGKHCRRGRSRE
ncbi:putative GPI-anchored protein PB15E9.01c-like protein [Dinothrombium tinctorium]|uniref:Putative GPI-anchored protein PB15E9.01c-like protein n=1 Tax=Dinothrombium tinctorium TaxID=1965070 RepID=A0A3S4QI84_9ACAR|nr:putative GPI-anchored protein PB15E9.01c-like protein [Dinothrombium tinctorium]